MNNADTLAYIEDADKVYVPTEVQGIFHENPSQGRFFLGANKSGKTRAGVNEDVWWMIGRHPYQAIPKKPTVGWIVSQTHDQSKKAIRGNTGTNSELSELGKWLKPYENQIAYRNTVERTIVFKNGNQVCFMSSASEYEAFQGAKIDWCHFDEIPDQEVFEECMLRLVDRKGRWWMTATATEGTSCWTYESLWEQRGDPSERKNVAGEPLYFTNPTTRIFIINPSIYDNVSQLTGKLNLDEGFVAQLASTFSETKRKIRLLGQYATFEGLVFAEVWDSEKVHVAPFTIPDTWHKYRGIDYGYSEEHPFICHWLAQSPDNDWYLYRELAVSGNPVSTNGVSINSMSGQEKYFATVDDPKGGAANDELARHGIYCVRGEADPMGRYDKLQELLSKGKFKIFKDAKTGQSCAPTFVANMTKFRWPKKRAGGKPTDRPQLLHNDAIDATGYVLLLGYPPPAGEKKEIRTEAQQRRDIFREREKEFDAAREIEKKDAVKYGNEYGGVYDEF